MIRTELRQDATFCLTGDELQELHAQLQRDHLNGHLGDAGAGSRETLEEIMGHLREALEEMGIYG